MQDDPQTINEDDDLEEDSMDLDDSEEFPPTQTEGDPDGLSGLEDES